MRRGEEGTLVHRCPHGLPEDLRQFVNACGMGHAQVSATGPLPLKDLVFPTIRNVSRLSGQESACGNK